MQHTVGCERPLEQGLTEQGCALEAPGEPAEMQIPGPRPELWIQQMWGRPTSAFRTHSWVVRGRSTALSPPRFNRPFKCMTLGPPEALSEVCLSVSKLAIPAPPPCG